ncbi:hypothetical protein KCU65_g4899, partial [Aureobasidium melanogenum]
MPAPFIETVLQHDLEVQQLQDRHNTIVFAGRLKVYILESPLKSYELEGLFKPSIFGLQHRCCVGVTVKLPFSCKSSVSRYSEHQAGFPELDFSLAGTAVVHALSKAPLNKRIAAVEASLVSTTITAPTSNAGHGPPTIYSGSVRTITTVNVHTVSITKGPATSTTTITISASATTVTTNSTVTIDQRTLPTTCISNHNSGPGTILARSSTCISLELHIAFVWVMMKDPFGFCAYYLTANGNTSPLLEMSASTLKDTCNCLVAHRSAPLPVFEVGAPYSPKPKRQCNQSVASLIKAKFKEPQSFCKFYTSTWRSISPFSVLKPEDVFAGCSCLIS